MSKKVRWGILGLGSIAHRVMRGIKGANHTQVLAAASRSQGKADAFTDHYHIPRSYGSYDALLADPDIDLAYIALPNHLHMKWTLRAIKAGKHVLCEKPFAMNTTEARKMIAAARRRRVFLMEAFMYRCHPQMARLKKLLAAGTIGQIRMIKASFSYGGVNEANCRMMRKQGGGGLMDVGCYPVSFFRMVAGQEPSVCRAVAVIGKKSRVDHWAAGFLKFPNGIIAHFDCGMMVNTDWSATLFGTRGRILLPSPWIPEKGEAVLEVTRYANGKTKVIRVPGKHYFAEEAEAVARSISRRQAPEMTWKDTLGNMKALDALRASMGLTWT